MCSYIKPPYALYVFNIFSLTKTSSKHVVFLFWAFSVILSSFYLRETWLQKIINFYQIFNKFRLGGGRKKVLVKSKEESYHRRIKISL